MPPIVTTSSEPTSSSVAFFSMIACLSRIAMCRAPIRPAAGRGDGAADRLLVALVPEDGHGDVPGHDERAGEVERAAQRADHVVGMHGRHGLGEGVDQEALLVVFAPHQALLDAGDPHRPRRRRRCRGSRARSAR